MTELEKQTLTELIEARAEYDTLFAELETAREAFKTANAELFDKVKDAAQKINDIEAAVSALTVSAYNETGNKKPLPGCGIRVSQVLDYDKEFALAWAKQNMPVLVSEKLDVKAFEKVVSTLFKKPDFITVQDKITPTISQKLTIADLTV